MIVIKKKKHIHSDNINITMRRPKSKYGFLS